MIWVVVLLIGFIALYLSGCKKPVVEEVTKISLSVPYEKYAGPNWCLPASGAMVLKYYGENITQAKIASKIIVQGTSSIFKMVSYARELGYESKFCYIDIKEIEGYLREEIPLIAIQKYSSSMTNSHSRVVIGFDSVKSELTLHDPSGKSSYKISYEAFFDLGFDGGEKSKIILIKGMK